MATKRRRISRHRGGAHAVDPAVWAVLHDEPGGFVFDESEIGRAWRAFGSEILARWITKWPGTRPSCWWRFDAPEPRRRLGGHGTPSHGALAHADELIFGLPARWIGDWWIEKHGLNVERFDPEDPPRFESQSAFLHRLGLLMPGEARHLARAPAEEVLPREIWPVE